MALLPPPITPVTEPDPADICDIGLEVTLNAGGGDLSLILLGTIGGAPSSVKSNTAPLGTVNDRRVVREKVGEGGEDVVE